MSKISQHLVLIHMDSQYYSADKILPVVWSDSLVELVLRVAQVAASLKPGGERTCTGSSDTMSRI